MFRRRRGDKFSIDSRGDRLFHRIWIPLGLALFLGCSEGPFWTTGKYVPWVRQKWEAEEQAVDTLLSRKEALANELRNASTLQSQTEFAKKLGEIVQRDPVLLMRVYAVEQLGQMDNAESRRALQLASRDRESRVRMQAIRSWVSYAPEIAVPQLQEIIGTDDNVDVRLMAISALGSLAHPSATRQLALALEDANPAIQLRATESLAKVTGENFGPNVQAWQDYLRTASSAGVTTTDELKSR